MFEGLRDTYRVYGKYVGTGFRQGEIPYQCAKVSWLKSLGDLFVFEAKKQRCSPTLLDVGALNPKP